MPKELTLKKVEDDIAKGNLGKARDRLHGLISTYPNVLSLRNKLGQVYSMPKYPSMAGRYWYLEEEKSNEMKEACEIFEKEFSKYPLSIWQALKFRGDVNEIDSDYTQEKLKYLQDKIKKFYCKETDKYIPVSIIKDKIAKCGCIGIIVFVVLSIIYTITNIIMFFLN